MLMPTVQLATTSRDPNMLLGVYQWRILRSRVIRQIVTDLIEKDMIKGIHYGKIGTSDKDNLLQPGADLILSTLQWHAIPRVLPSSIIDYGDETRAPTLRYDVEATIIDNETGEVLSTAIGSCNNREKKYAYRWVQRHDVPSFLDPDTLLMQQSKLSEPDFAIKKRETAGKWGKPEEHWDKFEAAKKDFEAGKKDGTVVRKQYPKDKNGREILGYEIVTTMYRIPNMEAADIDNTLIKMAFKRARVSATIFGSGSGYRFTSDLEDIEENRRAGESPSEPAALPSEAAGDSAAFDGANVNLGVDQAACTLLFTLAKEQKGLKPPQVLEKLGRKGKDLAGIGFRDAIQMLGITHGEQQSEPLPFENAPNEPN